MTAVESLRGALADRYSIEREIGAGGMATVYLARDLRHERDVALKVLKPELGAVLGTERFLSEIRVTAKLQHPNLLPLFDSGEANGLLFYVMPFVEGESLRARLDREKQLPVDEAVRIATAVASALDYAHRHGVIHRDLKPENILLSEGQPLVADFGIALAVSHAGGQRVTQTGLSLGTPQYMSPEQATGDRIIDGRTDVYSLGAITYEMLAGEPPHMGNSSQAIIAKLMTEEPRPLTVLRRSVPPHVDDAVRCALEKLPADRPATAHAFAEALANPSTIRTRGHRVVTNRRTPLQRFALPIAGAAIVAVLVAAWALVQLDREPGSPVLRNVIPLDASEALSGPLGRIALSPDGSRFVYTGGPRGLFLRDRSQLQAVLLPGTESALSPAFSPDGERIAFFTGTSLKVISTRGGAPVTITDSLVGPAGLSWGSDGYLYVDGNGSMPLVRVRAQQGAVPTWLTVLDSAGGEFDHVWPDLLPNGKGVLFTIAYPRKVPPSTAIGVADAKTGKHTVLLDGMHPRYSSSGHLLYVTANGTIMAVPFDQRSLEIHGEPTVVTDGLRLGGAYMADLAVSRSGSLLYVTGRRADRRELVWVSRTGEVAQVDAGFQGSLADPALSPDGKHVAVTIWDDKNLPEIWTKELDGGFPQKLTVEGSGGYPSWTADGKSVTYVVNSGKEYQLWTKRADGSAAAVRELNTGEEGIDPSWSPDGKWLVFRTFTAGPRSGAIYGIRPGVDSAPILLVASTFKLAPSIPAFSAAEPAISPDGRWMAYVSVENSGPPQLYVVPFPNTTTAKWAVSSGGGVRPAWSHHSGELFYQDPDGNMVSVAVKTNPTFSVGRATVLFKPPGLASRFGHFEISPDDRRFLMMRSVESNTPERLIIVDNWFEELRSKAALRDP